jgi:hypothetical protein
MLQVRTVSVDRLGKGIAAPDSQTLDHLINGLLELVG